MAILYCLLINFKRLPASKSLIVWLNFEIKKNPPPTYNWHQLLVHARVVYGFIDERKISIWSTNFSNQKPKTWTVTIDSSPVNANS